MKFKILGLALAGGIFWGISVFGITLANFFSGDYAADFIFVLKSVYIWYPGMEVTLLSCFIGLVEGFLDGFVGGAVFAWLYNRFV